MIKVVIKDIFLKLILNITKNYMICKMVYHFYQKEWGYNKLVCDLYDKNNYVVHIRTLKQALSHGVIF